MKRSLLAASLLVLVASTAHGSLYLWNYTKRPPIELEEALRRAKKMLGEDAKNRYCIQFSLYGNKEGDGKECGWNLYYAAEDGSVKQVFIDETGEGTVELWNGPIDWKKNLGPRTGLDDIATRLNGILGLNGYAERATATKSHLVLRAKSRSYCVYSKTKSGEYSDKLVKLIGPKRTGVVIDATEVNYFDRDTSGYSERGPYWELHRQTYRLSDKNRFVKVEIKFGDDISPPLRDALIQVFSGKKQRDF